jgi:hypothetical protein
VQHGRFHLQEAVLHHELADAGDRLAARHEALARLLVGHQVDIALAVLDFLVVDAVELVGQRAQALGDQAHLVGVDGELAHLGLEQHAFGATMSPRSQCLKAPAPRRPRFPGSGRSGCGRRWGRTSVLQVAKLALPITRLSIMRPATLTVMACGSSSSLGTWPCLWCRSAAWCFGLKSFGKATPCERMALSFSRRSAMSWFSSAAGAGVGWVIVGSGCLLQF